MPPILLQHGYSILMNIFHASTMVSSYYCSGITRVMAYEVDRGGQSAGGGYSWYLFRLDYCMLFSVFCSIEIVIGGHPCNGRNVVFHGEWSWVSTYRGAQITIPARVRVRDGTYPCRYSAALLYLLYSRLVHAQPTKCPLVHLTRVPKLLHAEMFLRIW